MPHKPSETSKPDLPETSTDIALVGAGPIGLELAVALKQAGLDYVHLEAGQIGATMQWWAPGTKYFSSPERIAIAGVPIPSTTQDKSTREDYLAYLRAVAAQFSLNIRTYTRVERATKAANAFLLDLAPSPAGVGGPEETRRPESEPRAPTDRLRARRLILAIGDMHRPQRLDIPGEDLPHVSHYLADPHTYFGKRVLIVGGKNSAAEAAIRLYRTGARVTVSYRGHAFDPKRVKYWIRPELEWLIDKGRIDFHPSTIPTAIRQSEVDLARHQGNPASAPSAPATPTTIPADFVLLLTGYRQDVTLYRQLGVNLIGEGLRPEHDRATMQTNIENLYVAGTGAAGTQIGGVKVFIENAHAHVHRIIAALTGASPPTEDDEPHVSLPEA